MENRPIDTTTDNTSKEAADYKWLVSPIVILGGLMATHKIENAVNREKLYANLGILGGVTILWFASNPFSGTDERLNTIGKSVLFGSATYSISRAFFKQNTKNSLIFGSLVLLGTLAYGYKNFKPNEQETPLTPQVTS